jgi:TonB-linked SusC/RagA family outer membrane protein
MTKNFTGNGLPEASRRTHSSGLRAHVMWKVMKISLVQITVAMVFSFMVKANENYAQKVLDREIVLSVHAVELEQVLRKIEELAKVKFVYSRSHIELDDRITISTSGERLGNVLDELLTPRDIRYKAHDVNGYIVLTSEMPSPTSVIEAASDNTEEFAAITVTGKVTASDQTTIPGVSILVKGTTTGTVTDADGNYSVKVPDATAILVFSSIGYLSQEVPVGDRAVIDIILLEDVQSLEEVVVVGYGVQKKINVTGAVSTVNSDVLESRPITNLGQALQGTIPNLNISQASGALGSGSTFNVRGNTSINGGSPLILVNNIPMDINLINPNDIESVTVLKDAASAAIYGARAAYGVILITTKKGSKALKPQVTLSSNYSVNTPVVKFETMDAMERMTYMNEANMRVNGRPYYQFDEYYEAAITAHYNDPTQPETFLHPNLPPNQYGFSANTDWPRVLLRDSYPMQQYTATVSGGSDRFDYYTSLGYFRAEGITKNFDEVYSRYNLMTNLNYDLTDWMRIGTKISINTSNKTYPPNDRQDNFNENRNMFQVHQWPNWPVFLPDGKYASAGSVPNVLQMHKEGGYRTRDIFDSWMTGTVMLTPVKNMTFNLDYSFNMKDTEELDYRRQLPMYDRLGLTGYYPYTNPSSVSRTNYNNRYYVFNAYADYENTFREKHYVKVLAGFNQENASNKDFMATREKLMVSTMPYMDLAFGERYAVDGESEYAIRGAFFRANYSFNDKYFVEFNGRYDGSSKFPKSDRFAMFPSVSMGWRIDNEAFFGGLRNSFDLLKLRVSYGNLGNQNVPGFYPYIATYTSGLSNFLINGDNQMAVFAPGLVSPTLTWETVTQQDIGIDFSLLENKLSGSFDVYKRETKNMLTRSVTLPAVLAVVEPQANAADMKTTGFDLSINWTDQVDQVKYGISLLLSDYSAEITKYSNPSGIISDYYVGKSIGEIWGLETGGIFQTDDEAAALDQSQINGRKREAGDLWFVDQDGDAKITRGKQTLSDHGDMKIIGNSTPRYSYGFRTDLSWKGINLNIFFQGVAKRDLVIAGNHFVSQYNDEWGVQGKIGTDWWSPTNRDAYFPRPLITGGTDVTTVQTRYMQNAAYLRLKQLTLAYSLPTALTKKIWANRIQVYVSGNNLWEATKMIKIADPEQSSARDYPLHRAYSAGLNFGF